MGSPHHHLLLKIVNAQGWSKTTELLLLPVSSSYNTSSIAAEVSKLANPVFGFTDPNWIYNSKAMGNLHPYDSASFELAEEMLDGTVKLYYDSGVGAKTSNLRFWTI